MTDQTREQNLEELSERETVRHYEAIRDLQMDYQRWLEDENTRHAQRLHDIYRALNGEHVRGICATCGQDYNTMHYQVKEGICPRCGARLED